MSSKLRSLALGGTALFLVIGAGQALAADANQIADALIDAMQASDSTKASYETATADGDNVTITGFSAINPKGGTITIPTILIAGATPRSEGGFTATGMTFDNGKVIDDDSDVSWATGSLADATVPSADEIKQEVRLRPFSRVDVGGINIEGSDLPAPLTISAIGVALDIDDQGNPRDFDMSIDAINVPPEVFAADPQAKAMLDELGYNGFVIDLDVAGAYETDGDKLTLRTFTIEAPDVGKLAVTGKFQGVPMSKIFEGDDPGAAGANGSLETLSIRFDNAGVVGRVLDMQAKMMGVSRDDVVAQNAGALPFMLNFLGNPPFQDKVAKAGASFLNDPQSLTITVMPSAPVKFTEIMGAANQAPQTLPDLLVVDINANN